MSYSTNKKQTEKPLTISQLDVMAGMRHEVHRPTRGFADRRAKQKADRTGRKAKHKGRRDDD